MRGGPSQRGLTLVEVLVAMAIAAVVIVPLARAMRDALTAQTVGTEINDVSQQARFAMQRMVAAVQRTAPHTLSAKSATTTADWLDVTFCLNGSGQIIETTSLDLLCALSSTVVADRVTTFSVQTYAAGANAQTVIEIQLTITGAGGQRADLTSHTRLGGGTL